MSLKKKGPKRDAKGRFVSRVSTKPVTRRPGGVSSRNGRGKPRDALGRFVSKVSVRTGYVREIEDLRREVERLKREGKERAEDIERNYRRRGGAYDRFVSILAIGQQKKIDEYLNEVYDGKMSKEDFVTMSVAVGLTVREAWAVIYS